MDKSWITMPRNSTAYDQGIRNFLEFAFQHSSFNDRIMCPCPLCGFCKHRTRAEVYDHLICKPFPKGYTIWYLHGEPHPQKMNYVSSSVEVASQTNVAVEDPIRDMVNDAFGVHKHHLEGNKRVRHNDEARRKHEDLVIRSRSSSENEAFSSSFGKEHPGYVRGMGLGVVPTQMYGSLSNSGSRHASGVVSRAKYNALKNAVERLAQELKELKEQVAFFMTRENQNVALNQENAGSPAVGRSSSQGSHSGHGEENLNRSTQ